MPKIAAFTIPQVATLFGVSPLTVRDWITDENGLRAMKINRVLYISADEVKRFYEIKYGHIESLGKP